MYTNIIHNDDICNYFLKNQQFIFNSLGNCRECRIYRDDDRNLRRFLHAHFMRVNVFLTKQYTLYRGAPMHIPARALQREMRTISLEGQGRDSA